MVDLKVREALDAANGMVFQDTDGTWKLDLFGEKDTDRRGKFKKMMDVINNVTSGVRDSNNELKVSLIMKPVDDLTLLATPGAITSGMSSTLTSNLNNVTDTVSGINNSIIADKFFVAAIAFRDNNPPGTVGGAFTSGVWQNRVLNVEAFDPKGIGFLSGSSIVLTSGTYRVDAVVPFHRVNAAKARIYNATANSTLVMSDNAGQGPTEIGNAKNNIIGYFTLSTTSTIAVQHLGDTTVLTSGMGAPCSVSGFPEIYTMVDFIRIG